MMRILRNKTRFCIVVSTLFVMMAMVAGNLSATEDAKTVSLGSLLDEMIDRDTLCQWPNPEYVCRQFSSYDPASVSPEEDWFANGDCSKFLRAEENAEGTEWVLMEADGPGAIVRFWITAPKYVNNLRFYIDDVAEPEIFAPSDQVIGGDAVVGSPLSQVTANGRNLYLPIPYAKKIKITCDLMEKQEAFYYQINYRTYAKGTPVESLTLEGLKNGAEKIAAVNKTLVEPPTPASLGRASEKADASIPPGRSTGRLSLYGPSMITRLKAKVEATDVSQALRSCVLSIRFDGVETVRCPLGDFFGGGIGINPYKTWYTDVTAEGEMACFWPMPFKRSAEIEVFNYGKETVELIGEVTTRKSEWTDRSMYFHTNWRQERNIETVGGDGTCDWNYLAASGRGVYVGDSLSLLNRDPAWWGEGDEKIYIDGEIFPSHFGTGTEDYYGYAWGTAAFFDSPWRAQPRAEGPGCYGNVTNLRFRGLDAIPFTKDFRFDMEIWHWSATVVDYSVATYWYGLPGAQSVGMPKAAEIKTEAESPVSYKTPFTINLPGFRLTNPEEPVGGNISIQGMVGFGPDWKEGRQLFWREPKVGDRLSLQVAVEKGNPKTLRAGLTAAVDYGTVQFWLDGEKLGEPVDLFHAPNVVHREVVFEKIPPLTVGDHRLEIEVIGKNEKSVAYFFGTDFLIFE